MSKRLSEKNKLYLSCYALLLPTFALIIVFTFIPFFWAFQTSFFDYEVGGPSSFVGFSNYIEYFNDPTFLPSFGNMLFLTTFALVVVLVFPLLVAKLIFSLSSERARHFYRVFFLIPLAFPNVAMIMIWGAVVYGEVGLLNELLAAVGLEGLIHGWLSDPDTVLWSIALVGFPYANGIQILIYYAGFSNIPTSVYEAAELEGARGLRKFFQIEIPMLFSQIKLLAILAIIMGIQGFENVLILTRGGPGFESMVPGLWMYYNAFSFQRMGIACAIGVILFFLILGITYLNLRYIRSSEEMQGVRK